MRLNAEQRGELESILVVGYDGSVSARTQMVLWRAEGRSVADIAAMAGTTTRPTVYKWLDRYADEGLAGLENDVSPGRPQSVSGPGSC